MGRSIKSEQLQIRVSPAEKAALAAAAERAGQSISSFVRSRALPRASVRLAEIVGLLVHDEDWRYALAEINDLLTSLDAGELAEAIAHRPAAELTPYLENYLAAMIEQAAAQKGVAAPDWLGEIEPLEEPRFAVPLRSLRLHLLHASPVPFRRRNLFVDSGVGDRV